MVRSNGLEQLATLATCLTPCDEVRLIERVASGLERDFTSGPAVPRRSLYGICADLGAAPAADVIDEGRSKAWTSFPRQDMV